MEWKNQKHNLLDIADICELNGRKIEFVLNHKHKLEKCDRFVTSLNYGKNTLNLHDEVIAELNVDGKTFKTRYEIMRITQRGGIVELYSELVNLSATYILPLLGGDYKYFSIKDYFSNSYMQYRNNRYYVCVKYRVTPGQGYSDLDKRLREHRLYCDKVETDPYHTIYRFYFPDDYRLQLNKFLEGKYSEFTKQHKYKILTFFSYNDKSRISMILNKDETLKSKIEELFGCTVNELENKPLRIYEFIKLEEDECSE